MSPIRLRLMIDYQPYPRDAWEIIIELKFFVLRPKMWQQSHEIRLQPVLAREIGERH
jgi:hypothetical protein